MFDRQRQLLRFQASAWTVVLCSCSLVRSQTCAPYWEKATIDPYAPVMTPSDMRVFDDGSGPALYLVSGSGTVPPGWRWKNGSWQVISDGLGAAATELVVLTEKGQQRLYAARLDTVNGQTVFSGRRWNGTNWEPGAAGLITNRYRPVLSADLGDGMRIFGKYGPNSSSPHLAQVNVWNGTSWSVVGDTNALGGPRLVVFDDGAGPALYAASDFTMINGVPAPGFAKWRNGTWTAVGTELFGRTCGPMVVFDDGSGPAIFMYYSTEVSPLGQEHIAKWNGQRWLSVGGGLSSPNGFFGIQCQHVFDDGSGPALYVGGVFDRAGAGLPVRNLARWNGQTWSAVGWGSGAIVEKIVAINDGPDRSLFIGGSFINVGGGQSPDTSRWVGCPNCDGSTGSPRLTANDFMCFINRYVLRDPYANCTVDEVINAADFACFISKWAAGCS